MPVTAIVPQSSTPAIPTVIIDLRRSEVREQECREPQQEREIIPVIIEPQHFEEQCLQEKVQEQDRAGTSALLWPTSEPFPENGHKPDRSAERHPQHDRLPPARQLSMGNLPGDQDSREWPSSSQVSMTPSGGGSAPSCQRTRPPSTATAADAPTRRAWRAGRRPSRPAARGPAPGARGRAAAPGRTPIPTDQWR